MLILTVRYNIKMEIKQMNPCSLHQKGPVYSSTQHCLMSIYYIDESSNTSINMLGTHIERPIYVYSSCIFVSLLLEK